MTQPTQSSTEPQDQHEIPNTSRSPKDYGVLLLKGFAMGSFDIVPGVSGGTMALILGIYRELIESIRALGQPPFLGAVFRFKFAEAIKHVNWRFLLTLGAGIALAVFTLANLLEHLLGTQATYVWSFFFGLIAASVITVSARVRRWHASIVAAFAFGAVFAFFLVGLTPAQTPESTLFLMFSGALAVCALILPGISGAFILVLLGKYTYVLGALSSLNIPVILAVGFGAVVGLVSFTQVLGWLFRRFPDLTIALLCGFMLGSLRKVWPFKEGTTLELAEGLGVNTLPPLSVEFVFALLLAALGFGLVYLIDGPSSSKSRLQ